MIENIPDSLNKTAPRLILVVDDEPRMIRFIRMNLELEGYQVVEASNGIDALDQVRKHMPELIIMDVMMSGGMDGLEATRILKNDPETKGCRIIMLTAKGQEIDKEKGIEAGADDYFVKPFSPLELIKKVEEFLG